MQNLIESMPSIVCYHSLTSFWVDAEQTLTEIYCLNAAEIALIGRFLGNYTFTYHFELNRTAFNYARFIVGDSQAFKQFSAWSFNNSKIEMSASDYLICQRLSHKGLIRSIVEEDDEYFELSPHVFSVLGSNHYLSSTLH